jgi:serine/threonine-protein kinase
VPRRTLVHGIADPAESAGGRTRTLAPDVLLGAVSRLRLLALVLLGFLGFGVVVHFALGRLGLAARLLEATAYFARLHTLELVGAGAALATLAATTWRRLPPARVLQIGVLFQIFGAYLFSQVEFIRDRPTIFMPAMPVATVWIMAFPLIPAGVVRSGLVALASAATGPLALFLAQQRGLLVPPVAEAAVFFMPLLLAAALSTLVSGVLYRLAADVTRERRLGSYELVKKIAEGAMGEVWRARHRSLIRPAAIKLIRPDLIGGKSTDEVFAVLRRFIREAQATSVLTSPHTVALYDFGRTRDGILYYVMELLSGINLEELVRRFGPLPAARVIHILRQLCQSLADAHRHGLVHRDVKPANIHVSVIAGEYDYVKVVDFGLVKLTSPGAADVLATSSDVIAGTPAYLSPEAGAGGGAVDGRSDLYAVGCVAYWLLTGKLVFEETRPIAMIAAHVKNAPVPPSARTELPVPPELDRLVLDLLAKDPDARPQSAAEVLRRLDAIALDEPWGPERAEHWWRAHLPDQLRPEGPALDKHEVSERACVAVGGAPAVADAS